MRHNHYKAMKIARYSKNWYFKGTIREVLIRWHQLLKNSENRRYAQAQYPTTKMLKCLPSAQRERLCLKRRRYERAWYGAPDTN